jgi:hypothetical protein
MEGRTLRIPMVSGDFQSIPITFWKIIKPQINTDGAKIEDEDENEDDKTRGHTALSRGWC